MSCAHEPRETEWLKRSFVEQTGESFDSPAQYLAHQRRLEREIQRWDDSIASFKADLSSAKKTREKIVGELRTLVREAKIAARNPAKAQKKDSK